MVKMYSLADGAVFLAVEMSVVQMLKLHLSCYKVSVAVVARAYGSFPLACCGCCLEVSQPQF